MSSAAPAAPAPPAPTEACPLCGAPLAGDQDWCLRCGAAARTRLAATPRWRGALLALAATIALALGVLAAALIKLAADSGPAPPASTTTVTATTAAAPATTGALTTPATQTVPPVTGAATQTSTGAGGGLGLTSKRRAARELLRSVKKGK